MADRLIALQSVKGGKEGEQTFWTRLGVAFASRTPGGWDLLLDAMPAPVDGKYRIVLRPDVPRKAAGNEQPQQRQSGSLFGQRRAPTPINRQPDDPGGQSSYAQELDDEIPF